MHSFQNRIFGDINWGGILPLPVSQSTASKQRAAERLNRGIIQVAIQTDRQTDRQTYIVAGDVLIGGSLNAVGEEAKNRSDPEQNRETTEKLSTELNPLWDGLGRRQFISSVSA